VILMTLLDADRTTEWLRRDEEALAPVLSRVFDLVAETGEGSWLVDVDGNRFLDLTSGIGVTNLGHCHPEVVEAARGQLGRLMHTSVVAHHQRSVELAEALGRHTPWFAEPQVFFCNTGAEAVEGAIKLARRTIGRPGIIGFRGGFHGRTMGAATLTTAKGKYREGYEPLLGGIHHAPYAYPLRAGGDPEVATRAALAALDDLLHVQAPASTVAAMIVEPVLGEGGYVPPPVEWLQGLRDRCDAHGILLVFDEVQSGIGRTGSTFAAERIGVAPDVLLFAKGIANGLPLGGIVAERSLMARWPTATHGTTFGGNPVSCAAALAVLEVLDREHLSERAALLGEQLLEVLRATTVDFPGVLEVRGLGLMVGVELASSDMAAAVQQFCFDERVLVLTCGPGENVLRLIPPLTISDDELASGLSVLVTALAAHAS
jgi:4-aminobutyrate aminotransferase